MANEFKHKDPCTELTQAEYIGACGDGHIFACQAIGDIVYASSSTVLSKLARGAANTVLSMGGSCIPAWTASPSVTDLTIGGGCITLTGAATDIDLIDNNASALSFDASGKTGIIDIVTTNCSEGVTMSGTLGVTGVLTATGGIELSHACQNTLTGSGGCLSIQGNVVYRAGGTDVPVADGGTGASSLTDGGILLGSGTRAITAMAVLADGEMIVGDGTTDPVAESGATLRTSIGVGTGDSPQFTDLTLTGGCITITNAATDIDLIDNNACALSFDASGQAGILAIDTQNCAEGVKMSGKLTVTGAISSTGALTVGVDDTGHDVKFFGAAAGAFMEWDESANLLEIRGATAAGPGHLKLTTGEATVVACDVLGKIEFQAPAECGTDAIVAGANIQAVAQATFSATVNNTDLLFMTGLSGAATEKFRFTANGELGIGGANYGTDGQVLTSTGAGTAPAWENAAGGGCVVCDTSPQLGGSLDAQNNTILNIGAAGNDIDAQGFNAVDGSNSAPSYAFTSDPDMGFYYLASGRMGWTANSGVNRIVFDACGAELMIMCTCNSKITRGITINQTDADNEVLAMKSCEVDHPLTLATENDTFGTLQKAEATSGGLSVRGYKSSAQSAAYALSLMGYLGEAANTGDTTGTGGVIQVCGRVTNGSDGAQAVACAGGLFVVSTFGTTRFLIKGSGELHGADTSITSLDNYCDVGLVRTLDTIGHSDGVIRNQWDDHVHENICSLIDAGLYSTPPWEGGLLNLSQLWRLHNGAIWQLWTTIKDQSEELLGLRQQINALEGK